MADRPQDLIKQTDAQLVSSGVPIAPRLNPAPQHNDPAMGPFDPTAPVPAQSAPAAPPDPAASFAKSPYAAPAAAQPPAPPGLSGTQYDTTTTKTTGSSGLSADAQKRQGARLDDVKAKQEQASADEVAAREARAQADVRATEAAVHAAAERRREAAAEQAVNDRITSEVDRKMQAASDWQPDRKNMFGFGAGRGIAAAVAIIAGGWMQGRGMTSTNQFLPFVMKMIDDDVNDQLRANSANIQFLREQKGDLKAAASELKKRQLMLVDSELQAKTAAAAAKDPAVAKQIEAFKSQSAAKLAEWDADQRKALERTVTEQVSRTSTPRQVDPNAGAAAIKPRTEDQAKAQSAADSISDLGTKAGLLRDADGKWIVGKGPLPPGLVENVTGLWDGSPIKAAGDAAVEAFGRLMSGGVIGDEERENFRDMLGQGLTSRATLAAKLNSAERMLQARKREADAAADEQKARIPYQRVR
jgi:hypothetical protein